MAKATQGKFNILKQICEHIPGHLVTKAAREYGVEKQSRTFSPWSHFVSLIYAQASHSLSLNDVCDSIVDNQILTDFYNFMARSIV